MSEPLEKIKIPNLQCETCKTIFKTISSLNLHKKTAKYCLILNNEEGCYSCEFCCKKFTRKAYLLSHYNSCSDKKTSETCENYKINLELEKKKVELLKKKLKIKCTKIKKIKEDYENKLKEEKEHSKELENKYESRITELESRLENIALKATSSYSDNFPDIIVTAEEDEEEEKEEEKIEIIKENTFEDISTLKINDTYQIECRQEDGYINVTNLCKAGGKHFKNWNQLEKTKSFIRILSSSAGIPADELVTYKEGSIYERATWVHPQVAINIAQWISPQFDVQVSGWVYEIMITGKVDIKNTKSYKELHKENKCKDLRIKHLENKYVKKQKRIQYKEEFVMYILTTPFNKSSGIYTLGIASNFTNRLSSYNKSEEHEVIYYQSCGSEDTMKLVENMVFKKLENYRCQANKEKFQLTPDINIAFFIDKIKECISFFN